MSAQSLNRFNLVGVLALIVLCAAQWLHDRRLNLDRIGIEKSRLEQAAKMKDQEQTIGGLKNDLAEFKGRLERAQRELDSNRGRASSNELQLQRLSVENEQLKASVTKWAAAVTLRDERLKQANSEIQKEAQELSASIEKFNALASNHNAVVKELNELRAKQSPAK